jgi:cell division septal protein FtsQ
VSEKAPPRVDTALLRRRSELARARGRRRRSRALGVLTVAALGAAGWWLASGPVFGVRDVRISGYERPDRAKLQAAVDRAARGASVLRPPVRAVREAATEFPWVGAVRVSRDWPRSLAVRVTLARPILILIPRAGRRMLVSDAGRVLARAPRSARLPTMRVAGRAPKPGASLVGAAQRAPLLFVQALSPETAGRVRGLRVTREGLTGRLSNGPELRLGPAVRLTAKAVVLDALLDRLTGEEEREALYLDLSAPDRPVLGTEPRPSTGDGDLESEDSAQDSSTG